MHSTILFNWDGMCIVNYWVKCDFSAWPVYSAAIPMTALIPDILIGGFQKGKTWPSTSRGIRVTRCQSWKLLKTPFLCRDWFKKTAHTKNWLLVKVSRCQIWKKKLQNLTSCNFGAPWGTRLCFMYLFGNLLSISLWSQTVMGVAAL